MSLEEYQAGQMVGKALKDGLVSVCVSDRNGEPANIVDVLDGLSDSHDNLVQAIISAGSEIAKAINNLADAVNNHPG